MKKLKELKIGQWIARKAPEILDVVDDYLPPVKILTTLLENVAVNSEERAELAKLLQEYEQQMYSLEIQDRQNARAREIEVSKSGQTDWLFYFTGIIGLLAFTAVIATIIFLKIPKENESLFIHMVGMIEGVAITIFAYYFGSSQREKEKS